LLLIQAAEQQVRLLVQALVSMISSLLANPTFTLMHSLSRHPLPLYFSVRELYQNAKLFLNDY